MTKGHDVKSARFSEKRAIARYVWLIAAASCAAAVLAGCSSGTNAGSSGASGEKTVTVPAILGLTGAQAVSGGVTKDAMEGLVSQINQRGLLKGAKLAVKYIDNQSAPSVAVTAAAPYLGKTPYLINASSNDTSIPVNALVKPNSNGPVVYNVSPALYPDPGSYIFVGTATTNDVANVSLRYASAKNWKRVSVITSSDPSGQNGHESVLNAVKQVPGATVVSDDQFASTDSSVSSQIAHVKAAKPDVIFLWTTGAQIGTVFQAMQTAGLSDTPTLMSYGNINFALMNRLKDVLPSNLYSQGASYMFTGKNLPAGQQEQIDLLYASLNAKPGQLDMSASYVDDGLLLYVDALNHLGLNATAQQIRDYIEGLKGWAGVDGIYNFSKDDHRGITGTSYGVVQYDKATGFFSPAPGASLGQ